MTLRQLNIEVLSFYLIEPLHKTSRFFVSEHSISKTNKNLEAFYKGSTGLDLI